VVAGSLASTLVFSAPIAAQDTPGIADYVPDSALFYSEFELDQHSSQYEKSAELLARANLAALLTSDQESELNSGASYLRVLAEGEAGVFLTQLPVEDGLTVEDIASDATDVGMDPEGAAAGDLPDGWAAVIHPDDAEASFDLYSDLVLDDEATAPEEVDYNGYTILSQPPADEYSDGIAIALVDDVIAIATTPDDIEPVIDTATGDLDPLSGDENYQKVRSALEEEVLASGYVNGPALLDALIEQDPSIEASTQELADSLVAYQGFVIWADDAGFRLDSVAFPAEGGSVAPATAYEPNFAANVPDSSLFFSGGNDLAQNPSLDALAVLMAQSIVGGEIATPIADPEAAADEVFAEAEGILGFNIKTDLLDNLVGEWAIAGSLDYSADDLENADVHGVFVTELDDDAAVADVTATITNMIASQQGSGVEITSRVVDGSDVTVVTVPDSTPPITLEFGVVNDQLLIGVNEGIDNFLDEQEAPLADSDTFQATLDALPADIVSFSFINVEEVLPIVEDAIAQSTTLDADPSCADYASQEEAQEAYDENYVDNYMLDSDYDGEACEDFFAPATPDAAQSGVSDVNVLSVGTATVNDGESTGSHTIILIGE
jgi:hypothetical protein